MSKPRNSKQKVSRILDLQGLQSGKLAIISNTLRDVQSTAVTAQTFKSQLAQCLSNLKKTCPSNVPFEIIVECKSPIYFRAVVPTTSQGALITTSPDENIISQNLKSIEESALAEAEQIAKAAAACSRTSIDVGNEIAALAEVRSVDIEELQNRLSVSSNEKISRSTYGLARGPEATIEYATGQNRHIGGRKNIPIASRATEQFILNGCYLTETKPGKFKIEIDNKDEFWLMLQSYSPGLNVIAGELDSPITQLLRCAAAAEIAVDIEVSVSERVSKKERWLEPIKILNLTSLFSQTHEWIAMLEQTLVE